MAALAAGLTLAAVTDARAGLTFNLDLYRFNDAYVFYTPLSTNAAPPAAPLGTYTIYSPQQPTNGSWLDLTIFPGDGTLKQFAFPVTNPPARFFRVRTD